MKVTSGYIFSPSSGTLSVANGTTSPMRRCCLMCFPLRRRANNLLSIDADAYALDDGGPAHRLLDDLLLGFIRRAGPRLHAKRGEMLLGFRRLHEIAERVVELH